MPQSVQHTIVFIFSVFKSQTARSLCGIQKVCHKPQGPVKSEQQFDRRSLKAPRAAALCHAVTALYDQYSAMWGFTHTPASNAELGG